ncbi:hypothetical protein [Mesorhizobium sp. ES1-1]|uniref:hypothetical protein n=1 Tax=Mesorhizobium sp. ES1-1 TaxID=2876629 RepID=UPI001CCEFCEF|nr:hypothetical protein [Mesorhizobium sp. ES1-1]MBZ9676004.1 hypothetical protein [Mesorhizobium sp. ES1-1]
MKWYLYKEPIVAFFGISKDALHIHFGLVAFAGIALLCRRRSRNPLLIAWIAVLVLEVVNEALDYLDWNIFRPDMASDLINTMLWPSLYYLGACLCAQSRQMKTD